MIFLNTINVTALSGIISPTNLGSGSGGSSKFLREDGTYQNISGGASTIPSVVEIDFGIDPVSSGSFTITGLTGLVPNRPIMIQQANGPYTGKGTLDDDSQMDVICVTAYALNNTTIKANWASPTGFVTGNFKFNYSI